jgi:hypothetical protein
VQKVVIVFLAVLMSEGNVHFTGACVHKKPVGGSALFIDLDNSKKPDVVFTEIIVKDYSAQMPSKTCLLQKRACFIISFFFRSSVWSIHVS